MLQIECNGSPAEIGYRHGQQAASQVQGTKDFYADYFSKSAKLDWPAVRDVAGRFAANIREKWPRYYEEMQGVARGSGLDFLDILALNVRTEIAFGLAADGCTSLAWAQGETCLIGQNWDVCCALFPYIRVLLTQERV